MSKDLSFDEQALIEMIRAEHLEVERMAAQRRHRRTVPPPHLRRGAHGDRTQERDGNEGAPGRHRAARPAGPARAGVSEEPPRLKGRRDENQHHQIHS